MRTSTHPCRRPDPAFSLIELVIVVVIIGIIAAIAVPRISSAVGNSMTASLQADLDILNKAADMYSAEHGQNTIATNPDGTADTDPASVTARLLTQTDVNGATGTSGAIFGPYLRALPPNPYNGLSAIRVSNIATFGNSAGWIFNTLTNTFSSDSSTTVVQSGSTVSGEVSGGTASLGSSGPN